MPQTARSHPRRHEARADNRPHRPSPETAKPRRILSAELERIFAAWGDRIALHDMDKLKKAASDFHALGVLARLRPATDGRTHGRKGNVWVSPKTELARLEIARMASSLGEGYVMAMLDVILFDRRIHEHREAVLVTGLAKLAAWRK